MKNKNYHFVQQKEIQTLNQFFKKEKSTIYSFGSRVNQTFEAYMIASVIKWYQEKGWVIKYNHPINIYGKKYFNLKFSTRGAPKNYSYVLGEKEGEKIQIHHQLRVKTKYQRINPKYRANICCDVAVIKKFEEIDFYRSDDAVDNSLLLSFGEAKHMSAFAELIAGFIGMVHELRPDRLRRIRVKKYQSNHLPPFLFVSGILFATAKGLDESISRRKFDIDVYSFDRKMNR
jgi:hypothetical protein